MNLPPTAAHANLLSILFQKGIIIYSQDTSLCYIPVSETLPCEEYQTFIGKTDFEVFPNNNAELKRLQKLKLLVLADGKSRSDDFKLIIKNKLVYYDYTVQAIYNEDKKIVAINCVSIDITDRKERELFLAKSERNLKEAEKISQLGHFDFNLINRKFEWSEGTYRIFGQDLEVGMPSGDQYLDMIHPEDRDKANKDFQYAVSNKNAFEMNYRIIRPDGSIRYIKRKAEVEKNETGKPIRSFGTILDVTDQKEIENGLKEQKEFIQKIIDASPAIIYILDIQNKEILFTNRGQEHIFGFPPESRSRQIEFLNLLLSTSSKEEFKKALLPNNDIVDNFIHHNDEDVLFDPYWKMLNDNTDKEYIIQLRIKNVENNWVWIHEKWLPFSKDEKGNISKILVIGSDITKLKNSELAARNAILETQDKERQRIAADLHDSINPLLSISKLNIESLKETLDPKLEFENEKLGKVISLLEQAINDIRNISADLMPSLLKDFGLVLAIKDLCSKISDASNIEIDFDSYGFNHRLHHKIEISFYRIAQELLNNVIKHSEATKTEVQVIERPNHIIMMIHDNGKGFNSRYKSGFGIGNIESRTKSLGGLMDIDSAIGRGTTMTIKLPNIEQGEVLGF